MILKGDLQDLSEPVGSSKDFIAFGSGLRLCVGVDFARLQMTMLLHFLVTKYRYILICTQKKVLIFYSRVCTRARACVHACTCACVNNEILIHHLISFILFSATD